MTWTRLRSDRGLWLILLPLIAVVIVPTVCVLWFANRAMQSEQLAVQQRLTEAYRLQLSGVQRRLDAYWRGKLAEMKPAGGDVSPGQTFARLVTSGSFDSVIIIDTDGRICYPTPVSWRSPKTQVSEVWGEATAAEYDIGNPARASELYDVIAQEALDVQERACALVAQARCLVKAGDKAAAIHILTGILSESQYQGLTDEQGRLIGLNAQYAALRLIEDITLQQYRDILSELASRLNSYSGPPMPASQRVHLMHEVQSIAPDQKFPTLEAELLAAAYVESDTLSLPENVELSPTPMPGIWQLVSTDRSVVALFRETHLLGHLQALADMEITSSDVNLCVLTPGTDNETAFLTLPASDIMPDWRLALHLHGAMPFASAAERQIAAYLWTGLLAVALIAFLTFFVARQVGRQVRLAQLGNDLVATVSHEMKTPLSSINLLLDILSENECRDRKQAVEYVGLITKETTRLGRLIDNFLVYSRMEQKRYSLVITDVAPGEVVQTALHAVRERFDAAGGRLNVEVPSELPTLRGDQEALVTVLVNLLDNACKYCENQPEVIVRAYAADGQVCFSVQDNGMGLSRRSVKRVFDRFYQVDQRLSRKTGGCGLGLSIVQFIVYAHGGTVGVVSEVGKGSTFTVRLPAAQQE